VCWLYKNHSWNAGCHESKDAMNLVHGNIHL
jgi:hypothetical protein